MPQPNAPNRRERSKPMAGRLAEQLIRSHGEHRFPGPLLLAFTRPRLNVVFYEADLVELAPPQRERLLGFLQRTLDLLGPAEPEAVGGLLGLPRAITDRMLMALRQHGGARVDAAGRWSAPPSVQRFDQADPPMHARRTRRLLCLWPGGGLPEGQDTAGVLLNIRPAMRRGDLIELQRCLDPSLSYGLEHLIAASQAGRGKMGCPPGLSIPQASMATALAVQKQVDVAGLLWVRYEPDQGLWGVRHRLWARLSQTEAISAGTYAGGPMGDSLAGPRAMLGESVIGALAGLFGSGDTPWRSLVNPAAAQRIGWCEAGDPSKRAESEHPNEPKALLSGRPLEQEKAKSRDWWFEPLHQEPRALLALRPSSGH